MKDVCGQCNVRRVGVPTQSGSNVVVERICPCCAHSEGTELFTVLAYERLQKRHPERYQPLPVCHFPFASPE